MTFLLLNASIKICTGSMYSLVVKNEKVLNKNVLCFKVEMLNSETKTVIYS